MAKRLNLLLCTALLVLISVVTVQAEPLAPRRTANSANITILSSNLANGAAIGEWGLSVLAVVDDHCVLFDTGRNPDTVIRNARALNVDLSCISDIVLSHFHFDHTSGLLNIVAAARKTNPQAIQRIHVAQGFFLSRRMLDHGDKESNQMIALRASLEDVGIEIIEHAEPSEILPAIWVSGPVQRRHPEKNYPSHIQVNLNGEWIEDFVPESQALTIVTAEGHIVILGCGHSGVVNVLDQVRDTIEKRPVHALMGGLHLFAASDETLGWTADKLRAIGVQHLMAGHCTGIEPLIRLRTGLNLNRATAVVGAVGSQFVYGEGIRPTAIAM